VVTGYNETGAPIRVDSGGMEYLATHIKGLSSENPNTFVVSAGDSMGASPLLSALFHDESTIKALNMMELDFSTVGNHDLDEGILDITTRKTRKSRKKHAFTTYFRVFRTFRDFQKIHF